MPESYTHFRTAWKSAELLGYRPKEAAAFSAGSNGPDFLYAFEAWLPRSLRKPDFPHYGGVLHRDATGPFLMALVQKAETPAQRDYALGFLSHYATDSLAHPFVAACMQAVPIYGREGGHGYFEIALDSWLHKKDHGSPVVRMKDCGPRFGGEARAQALDLFRQAALDTYGVDFTLRKLIAAETSLYWFQRLGQSPWHIKKNFFRLVEPAFGGRGAISGHVSPAYLHGIHAKDKAQLPRPWQDPFTGLVHDETVEGLLGRCARRGADYIRAAQGYWEGTVSAEALASLLGSRSYLTGLDAADPFFAEAEEAAESCCRWGPLPKSYRIPSPAAHRRAG